MRALACLNLLAIVCCVLSKCVTSNTFYEDLDGFNDNKIELTPVYISGSLNDIVLISVPESTTYTLHYLTDPEGENIPLDITSKSNIKLEEIDKKDFEIDYKLFDTNFEEFLAACNSTEGVEDNEFIIGPLSELDHGNWVLSSYVRVHGRWIELFQVITIQITEHVPIIPDKPKLNPGDTFEVSLAYPIEDLQSCEIVPPRSTTDRYYDRSGSNLDSCGYTISDISQADEGVWKILAVGRIVYEATVYLEINDVS